MQTQNTHTVTDWYPFSSSLTERFEGIRKQVRRNKQLITCTVLLMKHVYIFSYSILATYQSYFIWLSLVLVVQQAVWWIIPLGGENAGHVRLQIAYCMEFCWGFKPFSIIFVWFKRLIFLNGHVFRRNCTSCIQSYMWELSCTTSFSLFATALLRVQMPCSIPFSKNCWRTASWYFSAGSGIQSSRLLRLVLLFWFFF